MKVFKYFLFSVTLVVGLSCNIQTTTSTDSTASSSSSSSSSSTSSSTSCYSDGVGDQAADYYLFPDSIIGNYASGGTNVMWTSASLTTTQQQNFVTDSVLKFRIVAKNNPGRILQEGSTTEYLCNYQTEGNDYTKLIVTFRVRSQTPGYTDEYYTKTTEIIAVDGCSDPISVRVPVNSLDYPFVVEIMNVESDLRCIRDEHLGLDRYCPTSVHDVPQCFEFEIQMVTDWTKDFY